MGNAGGSVGVSASVMFAALGEIKVALLVIMALLVFDIALTLGRIAYNRRRRQKLRGVRRGASGA